MITAGNLSAPVRRELLSRIDDVARNVEARGFLLRDDTEVFGDDLRSGTGYVLRSPLYRVVAAVGRPSPPVVRQALAGLAAPWTLVGEIGSVEPPPAGWSYEAAKIAERPASAALPEVESTAASIRLLGPADRPLLAGLPEELADELGAIFGRVPTAAAFVTTDTGVELAAAFCSAYPETEGRWDLAIDTLAAYRRRGLARATSAFLIREMHRRGKRPVWGALESNLASIRLAESLGFEWVDELGVWMAPGTEGSDDAAS